MRVAQIPSTRRRLLGVAEEAIMCIGSRHPLRGYPSYMVTYKSHGGDDAVSAAGLSDQLVLLGLLNHLMNRLGLFVSVGAGANTEGKVQRLLGKLKRQLASDFL